MTGTLTLDDLMRLDDRLMALEKKVVIRLHGLTDEDEPEKVWVREIKPTLVQLVGWKATGHPDLRTEYAYDVVYRHLAELAGL